MVEETMRSEGGMKRPLVDFGYRLEGVGYGRALILTHYGQLGSRPDNVMVGDAVCFSWDIRIHSFYAGTKREEHYGSYVRLIFLEPWKANI